MYKNKNVKTKSSFSPALGFGGCNDTVHNYKKKMKPVKLNTYNLKNFIFTVFLERSLFDFNLTRVLTTCYQSSVTECVQFCSD